jgi:hypothetical protein
VTPVFVLISSAALVLLMALGVVWWAGTFLWVWVKPKSKCCSLLHQGLAFYADS